MRPSSAGADHAKLDPPAVLEVRAGRGNIRGRGAVLRPNHHESGEMVAGSAGLWCWAKPGRGIRELLTANQCPFARQAIGPSPIVRQNCGRRRRRVAATETRVDVKE